MRLFIAINLNSDVRSRIVSMTDELRSSSKKGNFTRPENIHLTLVFIGDCDEKQTNAVKEAMNEVNFEPFTLTISGTGNFDRRGGGRIWWAGVQNNKALEDIQRDLVHKITSKGIDVDDRAYTPHITFGRDVISDKEPWRTDSFDEHVTSIDLMRSERMNDILTYKKIYEKRAGE